MPSQPMPKVIYLDQKCWIDIAKIYYGESSNEERERIQKFFDASETGQAIFPLSLSHIEETNRIRDKKRKSNLSFLMTRLSKGYTFQPYFERLIRAEIRNIVLKKLKQNPVNIRKYILKRGISNLLGAEPTLVPKEGSKTSDLPEDLKKELLELIESTGVIDVALRQGLPETINRGKEDVVEKMEKIRHDLWGIKDNNLRKRVFLAKNMSEIVVPELAKVVYELQLPKDFFLKEPPSQEGVYDLLDNIPTALCLFTLIFERDQQLQRPIQLNDFNDIWFLSLAIPYSDIVVTEKMWASISKRTKLDKKCKTIVLSSMRELAELI